MFKVELAADARDDINQIVVFIYQESRERDIALAYLDLLEEKILSLEKYPERGSNPKYKILRNQGFKYLIIKSHIIFYKVNMDHKVVTVYRVLHHKSTYQNFL